MSTNGFVSTEPVGLRQAYGGGRVSMKISITDETHALMGAVGVIERIKNDNGEWVARKGGYGSAFFELAAQLVLLALGNHQLSADELAADETVNRLIEFVDKDDLPMVSENLFQLSMALKKL